MKRLNKLNGAGNNRPSILIAAAVALMLLAPAMVLADVATGEVGAGGQQAGQAPRLCIKHRDIIIGTQSNPPGVNEFDYRTGMYAFTGEQIEYTVVVRDADGALDIGYVKALVDGHEEALASETSLHGHDDGAQPQPGCDGFGAFNPTTDKAFRILVSVEPQWYGEKELALAAYDSKGAATRATHTETWFFNPAIALSLSTSDGQPIRFEPMPYGADTSEERTVHSVNKIKVKNTAEGGVSMWMFIAGTDLYDPSGASKCPVTNYIAIEDCMWYRGWTGTQWTSWEGWVPMSKYDQNKGCDVYLCYGALPVPFPWGSSDAPMEAEYALTNQGTLEIEFKLTYPKPCIGSFTQGKIYIFGKAV